MTAEEAFIAIANKDRVSEDYHKLAETVIQLYSQVASWHRSTSCPYCKGTGQRPGQCPGAHCPCCPTCGEPCHICRGTRIYPCPICQSEYWELKLLEHTRLKQIIEEAQ